MHRSVSPLVSRPMYLSVGRGLHVSRALRLKRLRAATDKKTNKSVFVAATRPLRLVAARDQRRTQTLRWTRFPKALPPPSRVSRYSVFSAFLPRSPDDRFAGVSFALPFFRRAFTGEGRESSEACRRLRESRGKPSLGFRRRSPRPPGFPDAARGVGTHKCTQILLATERGTPNLR